MRTHRRSNSTLRHFSFLVTCIFTLSGCSSWPEHGRGGMAEHYPYDFIPVVPNQPMTPEHGLRFDYELSKHQLDLLIIEGARYCFPATVVQAENNQIRIAREMQGDLRYDAANDLIIQRALLGRLENQLDYVKQSGACQPPGMDIADSEASQPEEVEAPEAEASDQTDMDATHVIQALYDLLNADNQFATDSAEINPKYMQRLARAVGILKEHPYLHLIIVGHTDVIGNDHHNKDLSLSRANQVSRYFQVYGIDASRLTVDGVADTDPLFEGMQPHVRLVNRRVSIEIIDTRRFQPEGGA